MKLHEFGALIRGITQSVNVFIGSQVEPYGIGQGQYEYFMHIAMYPGVNQLELARLKNVGKASVTKALKILEDDGFIIREADPGDRRNALCGLSPAGRRIVQKLLAVKAGAEHELFEGFSEGDKEALFALLTRLYANARTLASRPRAGGAGEAR